MPVHARDQELRLGLGKSRLLILPPHEVRSLLQVPRPLRLVKNGHMLGRWPGVGEKIIPKMMHVLDKGFDTLGYFPFSNPNPALLGARHLIPRKGFTQYCDQ